MARFFYFLASIIIPAVISWWLFIPLSLLAVYLIKLPYEIILAAVILDSVYYFGEGIWLSHPLSIFALSLIAAALFLNDRMHWNKII